MAVRQKIHTEVVDKWLFRAQRLSAVISLHLMHSHYSKRPTSLVFYFHLEFQIPYEQEKATLKAYLCMLNNSLSIVKS